MATSTAVRALARNRRLLYSDYICPRCRQYSTPTAPPAPPLLLKLRGDLKTAMKERDTNRLNVLKSLLADITNAAKTSNPISTNMQLLSLLRKRANTAKETGAEFRAAGRSDLSEKEEAQAAVLEEYAGSVETMGEDDIRDAVTKVVEEVKATLPKFNMGDVLKKLLAPGGSLDGKPVEKSQVARIVKQALGQ